MPVNYSEVLKDLEEKEAFFLTELARVRQAKPAIEGFAKQQAKADSSSVRAKYANMGAKGALRELFSATAQLLTRDEMYERLRSGGWETESKDPMGVISATLSQLVGSKELEKIGDRWRRPLEIRPDEIVHQDFGAESSLANTLLRKVIPSDEDLRAAESTSLPQLS